MGSSPSGAMITVDNQKHGATPSVVQLERKIDHIVKIEFPGHKPFETILTRKNNGWVMGNIFLSIFGLFGALIDVSSGSIYDLTPEQVNAILAKEGT